MLKAWSGPDNVSKELLDYNTQPSKSQQKQSQPAPLCATPKQAAMPVLQWARPGPEALLNKLFKVWSHTLASPINLWLFWGHLCSHWPRAPGAPSTHQHTQGCGAAAQGLALHRATHIKVSSELGTDQNYQLYWAHWYIAVSSPPPAPSRKPACRNKTFLHSAHSKSLARLPADQPYAARRSIQHRTSPALPLHNPVTAASITGAIIPQRAYRASSGSHRVLWHSNSLELLTGREIYWEGLTKQAGTKPSGEVLLKGQVCHAEINVILLPPKFIPVDSKDSLGLQRPLITGYAHGEDPANDFSSTWVIRLNLALNSSLLSRAWNYRFLFIACFTTRSPEVRKLLYSFLLERKMVLFTLINKVFAQIMAFLAFANSKTL